MYKTLYLFIALLACLASLRGNNIQIDNVSLASQNTAQDFYMIQFDLSWDNSWRTSTFESNWDAAWVFVKYTVKDQQNWQHADLHYVNGTSDGHNVPGNAVIRTMNNTYNTADGVGVMIYRATDGIGDISFPSVQIRWDYGDDGIGDDDIIEISVHAIEMVYVPQGPFYVGDGEGDFGQFEAGNSGQPFLISSENALTLGGTNINNLSNNDAINMLNADDFDYSTTRTLPAGYPKGFDAFYCMKYETSQEQYAAFLTQITSDQRNPRSGPFYVNATNVFPIRDGNYYADAEFPHRPMHYVSWADISAYLDWSGLRPMSELEYEKACRGPRDAVNGEFAWGNASWYIPDGYYTYDGSGADEIITSGLGTNTGNANTTSQYSGSTDPVRCGIFAASAENKTRQETGATYWGIMEMSGNCYELVISVGNGNTRDFDGRHGDGGLQSSGAASFSLLQDWAFVSGIGVGFRNSEISTRYGANYNDDARQHWHGIRGVRSAN
ncbi:MAG: SUMF1/EgtB/PvdO family nonheme iron enzyme [Bacteroidota bacterium]